MGRPLVILKIVRRFVKDMSADRDFFLSYLAGHRLNHTTFVINEMIKLNKTAESFLYKTIDEGTYLKSIPVKKLSNIRHKF